MTVRGIYKDDTLLIERHRHERAARSPDALKACSSCSRRSIAGANPEAGREGAPTDRLAAQFPTAKLQSNAEFKDSIGDQVNRSSS